VHQQVLYYQLHHHQHQHIQDYKDQVNYRDPHHYLDKLYHFHLKQKDLELQEKILHLHLNHRVFLMLLDREDKFHLRHHLSMLLLKNLN
jgi:hypothetical protein